MEKFGIENLKKVIDLGIELEALTVHFVKNGKDWAKDVGDMFAHVPSLVMEVQAVVAGGAQIPLEIKDLDGQEAIELLAYVSTKLAVDNVKAQAIIAASLQLASHMIPDVIALVAAIRMPAPVAAPAV